MDNYVMFSPLEGLPLNQECSICGEGVASLVQSEEVGYYYLCNHCSSEFISIKDMSELKKEGF